MKILETGGYLYSKKQFVHYKFRAKVKIKTVSDEYIVDIYTTDPCRENIENVLLDRRHESVTSLHIFHFCTREEDDASAKFINEWLK